MKRLLTLALALLFCLTACQKAPELTITSPASVDLSVDGSSGTITFSANRDWTISTSDSWVTVSPSSGSASDEPVTVTVRCGANTTYDDRSATVTIKMEELTQTVTVKQPANLALIVPTQSYEVEAEGGTIEVEVQSNVQYAVSTSVNWIKQTSTKGLISTTYTFSIEENETYDDREGTINIKSQNNVSDQVINVNQTARELPEGAVDLGIVMERDDGSTYRIFWRDRNLGAHALPGEFGDYYAWGEIEISSDYSISNYKLANGAYDKLIKYCPADKPEYWDGIGSPDGKMVLDPEDDVAHVILGGSWRMPTIEEFQALLSQCTWIWTTQNGKEGYEIKSNVEGNTNSIFLPSALQKHLTGYGFFGSGGYYWSSSVDPDRPNAAYGISFNSENITCGPLAPRFFGHTIRPVTE